MVMKITTTLALFGIASLFGAGCAGASAGQHSAAPLPTISISSPKNGTLVSTNTVEIVGRTNQDRVFVNQDPQPVSEGTFRVPVVLMPGQNTVTLVAGDGLSTTTQSLMIERSIPRP